MVLASSSWLITPDVGLTIWTLLVFGISLFILAKFAPILGAIREKNPTFLIKTSEMVRRFSSASQRLEAISKRLEATRGFRAVKSKKRTPKPAETQVEAEGELPLEAPEH